MKTRYRYNENPGGDSMSHYTYMVTNKTNGKVYVGSHSWDGEGLDPNYYGSGTAITRAVRKYGKENFQIEVLYYYSSVEECRADEERILTEYDVKNCPHSYNCKNGAIGWTSEDMKGKNNPMYGRTLSAEHRRKMSQANKGRTLSAEHKKKISQAITGEKHPMYGRTGEKHPRYGKHHTAESRRKMSQARTGEKHPMYGKHHTAYTRQKMSQAHKGEKNPRYGKHHTAETRQRMSESHGGKPFVAMKDGKVKIFISQMECGRVLGLHYQSINACLKGRRNHTGGYTFKYVEELESGIYEGML